MGPKKDWEGLGGKFKFVDSADLAIYKAPKEFQWRKDGLPKEVAAFLKKSSQTAGIVLPKDPSLDKGAVLVSGTPSLEIFGTVASPAGLVMLTTQQWSLKLARIDEATPVDQAEELLEGSHAPGLATLWKGMVFRGVVGLQRCNLGILQAAPRKYICKSCNTRLDPPPPDECPVCGGSSIHPG